MAAKGTDSKAIATQKILELFEGSFQYDKEIRLPFMENGEEIQLKCVLTCAKSNVTPNGDVAIPGVAISGAEASIAASDKKVEITDEDKANVERLAKMLGM